MGDDLTHNSSDAHHAPGAPDVPGAPDAPTGQRAPGVRFGAGRSVLMLFFAVLGLGVLARLVRYVPGWPLWDDEAALAVAIALRDYMGLTRALDINQMAPVGYLWAARASVDVFGFNELALRLPAFVAALVAIALMVRLARQLLPGRAWMLAVAVFVATHYHIRYSTEVKQYGFDTLFALLLMSLAVDVYRKRSTGAMVLLAVATVVAMFCSLPAAFVAGAVTLALLPISLDRQIGWRRVYPFVVGSLAVGSFTLAYFLLYAQWTDAIYKPMANHWNDGFVDFDSPGATGLWLLRAATGVMLAVPIGGKNFASAGTTLLCVIGIVAMIRRGDWLTLRLFVGLIALGLIAAALQRYPFGGHPRMGMYLLPMVAIVAGLGIDRLVAAPGRYANRTAAAVLTCLAILLVVQICKDVAVPAHGPTPIRNRHAAVWLWQQYGITDDLRDAAEAFRDQYPAASGLPRHYVCFRIMFGPDVPVAASLVPQSIDRPIGLVTVSDGSQNDRQLIDDWIGKLSARYNVLAHHVLPVTHGRQYHHVVWIAPPDAVILPTPDPDDTPSQPSPPSIPRPLPPVPSFGP